MKTLSSLVLLALICFLHHSSAAAQGQAFMAVEVCCQSYTQMMIPKQKVKHVMETSAYCPTKAIIVTTVCDKKYCIDPKMQWAKRVLREFQKSPGAPFNRSKCDKR